MTAVQAPELSEHTRQAFAERMLRELGAEQVVTGAPCAAYAVQGRLPVVVARPTTHEGVAAALTLAAEVGAAVVPWGAGSRMALGNPPTRLDLVVSMEQLVRIVSYDPADLTITVEAGMTHASLNRALAIANQLLPLDPPLPERATVGGTLATGIVGMRRARYGAPRELALGMRLVNAAGQSLKAGGTVVKNATGYGMTRLYAGSLGTLGVITEVSFKLTPAPETEATLLALAQPHQLATATQVVGAQASQASALVMMSVTALPELARLAPGHAQRAVLAARLPGTAATVKRASAEAESALSREGIHPLMTLDGAHQAAFWATVNNFPALRTHGREALARVNTLPTSLDDAVRHAEEVVSAQGLQLHWVADLATGTLWLRLSADDATNNVSARRDVAFASALRVSLDALITRWRIVTTLACPVALKSTLPLWGADVAGAALMREIKRGFDPEHRLNPGRFVADI